MTDIDKEFFPITIVGHPREKENGVWKILVRDNTSMDFLDVNCLYVLETKDAL